MKKHYTNEQSTRLPIRRIVLPSPAPHILFYRLGARRCLYSLVLALTLGLTPLLGQNSNAGYHINSMQTTNLVSIGATSYYVECAEDDSMNLVAIGNSGERLFKKRLDYMAFGKTAYQLHRTLDNQLLLTWSKRGGCDVFSPTTLASKFTLAGTNTFSVELPFFVSSNSKLNIGVTQGSDSSFYFSEQAFGGAYRYSKAGVPQATLSPVLNKVSCLKALGNGNLLFSGTGPNGFVNLVTSTTGVSVSQQTCSSPVRHFIEKTDGSLLGLCADGVVRTFSSNLAVQSASAALPNASITAITTRNDTLFCIAPGHYAVFSPSLALLHQHQLTVPGLQPTGIGISNQNRVSIVSTCNTNLPKATTSSAMQQLPPTGSLTVGQDIGVQSVTKVTGNLQVLPGVSRIVYLNVRVVVRNYSNVQVNEFYVSYKRNHSCVNHETTLYTQTIAPLGTTEVLFDCALGYSQVLPESDEICISTSSPNGETDRNNLNDLYCAAVSIATGQEELGAGSALLRLVPNPAGEQVKLDGLLEAAHLQIYCLDGSLLLEKDVQPGEVIHTGNWTPGLYFVKSRTGQHTHTQKLIKN